MLCHECNKETPDDSNFCRHCRAEISNSSSGKPNEKRSKSKLTAGLLALLFLGAFGSHKFYLGYKLQGFIMLVVSVGGLFLATIPTIILSIVAIVEGINYLRKSDEDFEEIYVKNKKPWL